MMIQLNPPLWLYIPEFDQYGLAHFVENHGLEHHLYWTVFLNNSEIWTLPNDRVRAGYNNSLDRVNNKSYDKRIKKNTNKSK